MATKFDEFIKMGIYDEGQVLNIPDEVRDELRLNPGDRVEFLRLAPHEYLIYSAEHPLSLQGMIGKPKRKVTIKDMNRAIRARGGHTI
ncbi:AbrB family transcriptional regulator [Roseateles sp. MS654]|uniref:AbrB family transcriptional regulator n=1 Tax=Roseateles sp. MS654 TaxID=3412685 RepID=UPI003C2DB2A9